MMMYAAGYVRAVESYIHYSAFNKSIFRVAHSGRASLSTGPIVLSESKICAYAPVRRYCVHLRTSVGLLDRLYSTLLTYAPMSFPEHLANLERPATHYTYFFEYDHIFRTYLQPNSQMSPTYCGRGLCRKSPRAPQIHHNSQNISVVVYRKLLLLLTAIDRCIAARRQSRLTTELQLLYSSDQQLRIRRLRPSASVRVWRRHLSLERRPFIHICEREFSENTSYYKQQ